MSRRSTPARRWLPRWASLLAALLVAACGVREDEGNSAGGVVGRYIRALSAGDVPAALACVAPDRRSQAEPVVRLGAELVSSFVKPEGGLDSVAIMDASVRGDRARVEFRTRTKKGLERRNTATAERIQGVWYVAP